MNLGQYKTKKGLDAHVTAVITKRNGARYLVGFTKAPDGGEAIIPLLWTNEGRLAHPRPEGATPERYDLVDPNAKTVWDSISHQERPIAKAIAIYGMNVSRVTAKKLFEVALPITFKDHSIDDLINFIKENLDA
jgi:hypothetical protein